MRGMLDFIRRLRPRHLYAAWGIWWLVLVLRLTPAFVAIWEMTRATPGEGKGSVSLSVNDGMVELVVSVGNHALWSGSRSFLALALLIGLPPLAMWLLWISARPAPAREREPVP